MNLRSAFLTLSLFCGAYLIPDLFPACLTASEEPEWQILTTDGWLAARSVAPESGQKAWKIVLLDGAARQVPASACLMILQKVRAEHPDPLAHGAVAVELLGGDRLIALKESLKLEDGRLRLRSGFWGEIELRADQLQRILRAPDQALSEVPVDFTGALFRNGDQVPGRIDALSEGVVTIEMPGVGKLPLEGGWDSLAQLVFQAAPKSSAAVAATAVLANSERLGLTAGGPPQVAGEAWRLPVAWRKEPLDVPVSWLHSLTFHGDHLYLSDLPPAQVELTPFLDLHLGWHRDRGLEGLPLSLDGFQPLKGLACHTRTELEFDLSAHSAAPKVLHGRAGIHPPPQATAGGRAELSLALDEKVVWKRTLAAGEAPRVLALQVPAGAKRLQVKADFGAGGSCADLVEIHGLALAPGTLRAEPDDAGAAQETNGHAQTAPAKAVTKPASSASRHARPAVAKQLPAPAPPERFEFKAEKDLESTVKANAIPWSTCLSVSPIWHLAGPFFTPPKTDPLAVPFPPDREVKLEASYESGGQPIAWRKFDLAEKGKYQYLRCSIQQIFPKDPAGGAQVLYAYAEFDSPAEEDGILWVNCNAPTAAFWNGAPALTFSPLGSASAPAGHARLRFKRGKNSVLLKMVADAAHKRCDFRVTALSPALLENALREVAFHGFLLDQGLLGFDPEETHRARLRLAGDGAWDILRVLGDPALQERFFAVLKQPLAAGRPVTTHWSALFQRTCEDLGRPQEGSALLLKQVPLHADSPYCRGANLLGAAGLLLLAGDMEGAKVQLQRVIKDPKHNSHHIKRAHAILETVDVSERLGDITLPLALGAEDFDKMLRHSSEAKDYDAAVQAYLERLQADRDNLVVDPGEKRAWGLSRYLTVARRAWPEDARLGFLEALNQPARRAFQSLTRQDGRAAREASLLYAGTQAEADALHQTAARLLALGQAPRALLWNASVLERAAVPDAIAAAAYGADLSGQREFLEHWRSQTDPQALQAEISVGGVARRLGDFLGDLGRAASEAGPAPSAAAREWEAAWTQHLAQRDRVTAPLLDENGRSQTAALFLPSLCGNRVVLNTGFAVQAFDAQRGTLLWRTVPDRPVAADSRHGVQPMPLLDVQPWQDLLFTRLALVHSSGYEQASDRRYMKGALYALRAADGRIAWSSNTLPALENLYFTSPPLVAHDGIYVLAEEQGESHRAKGTTTSSLLALDARRGEILWKRTLSIGSSAIKGNLQQTGSGGLKEFISGETPRPLLTPHGLFAVNHMGAAALLDPLSGEPLWLCRYPRVESGLPNIPVNTLACAGQVLLMAPRDSSCVYAMDATSSETLWTKWIGSTPVFAGIHGGRAFFVGREVIQALDVKNGECLEQAFVSLNGDFPLCDLDEGQLWISTRQASQALDLDSFRETAIPAAFGKESQRILPCGPFKAALAPDGRLTLWRAKAPQAARSSLPATLHGLAAASDFRALVEVPLEELEDQPREERLHAHLLRLEAFRRLGDDAGARSEAQRLLALDGAGDEMQFQGRRVIPAQQARAALGDPSPRGLPAPLGPAPRGARPHLLWRSDRVLAHTTFPPEHRGVFLSWNAYALQLHDLENFGEILWEYLPDRPIRDVAWRGERVLLAAGDMDSGYAQIALDAFTGAEGWRLPCGNLGQTAVVVKDLLCFPGTENKTLMGARLADGATRWELPLPANETFSSLILSGKSLYLQSVTADNRFHIYCVDTAQGALQPTPFDHSAANRNEGVLAIAGEVAVFRGATKERDKHNCHGISLKTNKILWGIHHRGNGSVRVMDSNRDDPPFWIYIDFDYTKQNTVLHPVTGALAIQGYPRQARAEAGAFFLTSTQQRAYDLLRVKSAPGQPYATLWTWQPPVLEPRLQGYSAAGEAVQVVWPSKDDASWWWGALDPETGKLLSNHRLLTPPRHVELLVWKYGGHYILLRDHRDTLLFRLLNAQTDPGAWLADRQARAAQFMHPALRERALASRYLAEGLLLHEQPVCKMSQGPLQLDTALHWTSEGTGRWQGPGDLSARLTASVSDRTTVVEILVRDDTWVPFDGKRRGDHVTLHLGRLDLTMGVDAAGRTHWASGAKSTYTTAVQEITCRIADGQWRYRLVLGGERLFGEERTIHTLLQAHDDDGRGPEGHLSWGAWSGRGRLEVE